MIEQEPLVLRPASPADAGSIAALLTAEGYPAGTSEIVARLERVSAERSDVLVAELGGEVLGFVAVHRIPRFEHGDHVVRILALVVAEDARDRGVGHRLMDAAESVATREGAAFIEVTAGHHRPEARRLYESVGYDATVTTYLRKHL